MNKVLTEAYKGNTIDIYWDNYPVNPRENENLGTMLCSHRTYDLGDNTTMNAQEIIYYANRSNVISLPIYLYDHSGIGVSTDNTIYPYNCPWDSGMVGYICVTKEKVKKEYGIKRITKKIQEKVLNILQNEVNIYHMYLSGQAYGYVYTDASGEEESCWSYFMSPEDLIEEVKQGIDAYEKRQLINAASQKAAQLNYALNGV